MLETIAVALAGRAGARLAGSLHVPAGRSTMLRLLMALADPPSATPRVLGVDDFALRRGHVYGTVLIDCESSAPVELLAGRDAQPLADWLRTHPGVEVICRDRSGAYAEGARVGAPDAVQVADRYHLWQNLGKAVERRVARHRACLRHPAPAPEPIGREQSDQPPQRSEPEELQPVGRFAERARRHHVLVHDLVAQGHGLRAIARQLGWGRHTAQRYARATTWQELVDGRWQQQRPSKLDAFKPHLRQAWEAGLGARLHQRRRTASPAHRPGLRRQLRAGARLPGVLPRHAAACRPGAANGPPGDRLAHPPSRAPDRG
jgi:hypothetical protein